LKAMERMNALFNGAYIQFCQELSTNQFFERHGVFSTADWRRMRDLDFCVILVTTLLSTYYHRDEKNREYLRRYNDEFPEADRLYGQVTTVFEFIDHCGISDQSRAWRKTDLFTLLTEVHSALVVRKVPLDAAM